MMNSLIEEYYNQTKDRLRVREEASNGSWLAINRGKLVVHAYRRLHNWEDAEDAVQEAFTRSLTFASSFKEGERLENWLYIVLSNVIRQMLRNKSSAPEMIEADDDNINSDEILTEAEQPFHLVVLEQHEEKLAAICRSMSDRDGSILVLYFKYGHTAPAVGQLLGVELHTVHRVIQENRRRIKG